MRELNIGGKQVRVRATPLALLYYKQAFKSDLVKDMASMFGSVVGALGDLDNLDRLSVPEQLDVMGQLDTLVFLQMIWAMAKADAFGQHFPGFETWVSELESIDLSDPSFLVAAMEEAADGFLGKGQGFQQPKK